jgi:hypothetical protein
MTDIAHHSTALSARNGIDVGTSIPVIFRGLQSHQRWEFVAWQRRIAVALKQRPRFSKFEHILLKQ